MKLNEDIRKVRSSKKTLTFGDKTSNIYWLDKEEYCRLLQNAVTRTYKEIQQRNRKNKLQRN